MSSEVEIIPFEVKYAEDFKNLNYSWISKYFEIEREDRRTLENPQETIIDPGGCILLARLNEKIVGTSALMKVDAKHYELVKMAVDEKHQGKQIGKRLGEKIVHKARDLGAQRITLESASILTPAITLYKKLGFSVLQTGQCSEEYERCDIMMELIF